MPTDRPMPRYTSHKVVFALKIASIAPKPNPDLSGNSGATSYGATLTPADEGFAPFDVSAEYVCKHAPQSGGYFVVYNDGYRSFSPADAFEAGYTPVDGPRVIDAGHRYRIGGAQVLQFMKKEPQPVKDSEGGDMVVTRLGTTNEELIDVLLDRLRYLDHFVPCRENSLAITKLEEAKHWLDARTRNRQAQGVEGTASMHV